jgi:hypothetical protein
MSQRRRRAHKTQHNHGCQVVTGRRAQHRELNPIRSYFGFHLRGYPESDKPAGELDSGPDPFVQDSFKPRTADLTLN